MEISNEVIKGIRKQFEDAMGRELCGSRDADWYMTQDASGNYPCTPIQKKWLAFKSKYLESNGVA